MVRTILIAGIRFQSGCDNLLRQLERTSKIFLAERGRNSESGCIVIVVGRVVETINHDAVAFDVTPTQSVGDGLNAAAKERGLNKVLLFASLDCKAVGMERLARCRLQSGVFGDVAVRSPYSYYKNGSQYPAA